MKKRTKIDYNSLLYPMFEKRRSGMNWTTWANHLKKIKVGREWVTMDIYSYGIDTDELLRLVNSRGGRYVYVIGGRKKKRGGGFDSPWKAEVYFVPRNLANKILVLGGVP